MITHKPFSFPQSLVVIQIIFLYVYYTTKKAKSTRFFTYFAILSADLGNTGEGESGTPYILRFWDERIPEPPHGASGPEA